MLIDLGRNDVGRVSQAGSVEVIERFAIERYSHVMHLSSTVEGKLQPNKSAIDVLRATLPWAPCLGRPRFEPWRLSTSRAGQARHLRWRRGISGMEWQHGHRHRHSHGRN